MTGTTNTQSNARAEASFTGNLTAVPLTMSSLEIAGLMGKRHAHVVRDIRQMLIGLYGDEHLEKVIPEYRRNRHSEYVREHAGQILEAIFPSRDEPDWVHPSRGFQWRRDGRGYIAEFYLDQPHTLTLVAGYDVQARKRIIDRWLQLEAALAAPAGVNVSEIDAEVRKVIGGIVKSVVHSELTALLPAPAPSEEAIANAVRAELAKQSAILRYGKTAGQIWKAHGNPPIRGIASWFGHKLAKVGCRIADNGHAELGGTRARLFDPDKAEMWLESGGNLLVKQKIAERRGQGVVRLVGKAEGQEHRPL